MRPFALCLARGLQASKARDPCTRQRRPGGAGHPPDRIALALANPAVKGVKRNKKPYTVCSKYIVGEIGGGPFTRTAVVGLTQTKEFATKQGLGDYNDFAIARA